MPFSLLLAATTLGSAAIGAFGAESAAQTQADAANQASQVQLQMYQDTVAREQPFVQAGTNSLAQLLQQLGLQPGGTGQGPLNTPFSPQMYQQSPAFQFQLQNGLDAITNKASAVGGVASGNTLKALTDYATGAVGQDYYTAMQNYMAQQNQQFNQLQTLAGSGQNAAANLGALGSQTGANIGNNITSAGAASAAGTVGVTNALTGGVNGVANNYLLAQILNGGAGAGSGAGMSATQYSI